VADSDAFPETLRRRLDALCLALAFAAIGVWFRPRAPAVAGLAIAGIAVALAPTLAGVSPSPAREWVGAAAGLAAGGSLSA